MRFGLETLLGCDRLLEFGRDRTPMREVVTHGPLERLSAIHMNEAFRSARTLLRSWHGGSEGGVATAWSPLPPGETGATKTMIRPRPDELSDLYAAGFLIAFHHIERFIPGILPLARRLERDLSLPRRTVSAEAFCSAAGGGAAPHFDRTPTFNCQIIGDKHWWFADNPSVAFPSEGSSLGKEEPLPRTLARECHAPLPTELPTKATRYALAKPGSTVFLPAGLLHATRTEGESLAVLFTIKHDPLADRIANRAAAMLSRHHQESAATTLRNLARSL